MQLVVLARRQTRRHWLDALSVTWPNQAFHIEWEHPPARLVPKPDEERRKPPFQISIPVRHAVASAKSRSQRSREILYKLLICQSSARPSSRPSVKFLSCAWLLPLELRRSTAGNVKPPLPPWPSRGSPAYARIASRLAAFEGKSATADAAKTEVADLRRGVGGRLGQSIDAALHASAVANELMTGVGSAADGASESPRSPGQVTRDTDDTSSGNGAPVSTLCRARALRALSRRCLVSAKRGPLDGESTIAGPRLARRPWSGSVPAALNAARSALAIAITSAFWIATAWPGGAVVVIVAGVVRL